MVYISDRPIYGIPWSIRSSIIGVRMYARRMVDLQNNFRYTGTPVSENLMVILREKTFTGFIL